jgi:D-alanine transaminase
VSRIAYVNGRYVPHAHAHVSIEDRGYQFADGVYEVIQVASTALVDEELHIERLRRSLDELRIGEPLNPAALSLIVRETVRRNSVHDGMVYIQVTRGVANRDHFFPDPPVRPSLVVTARSIDMAVAEAKAERGIRVVTTPDIRWKRPDIKSISLLPNVLAKQEARARGAAEAWLIGDDGLVTEGAASNAWIIEGRYVITHPVDRTILKGITRTTLLKHIADLGLAVEERPFGLAEAYGATEAFITGATTLVMPVIAIDDRPIGRGTPGDLVLELRRRFHAAVQPPWQLTRTYRKFPLLP